MDATREDVKRLFMALTDDEWMDVAMALPEELPDPTPRQAAYYEARRALLDAESKEVV